MIRQDRNIWLYGLGLGILFPLFFQLSGGIYRNPELLTDSGGVLETLPLPISILTCLIALVFLPCKGARVWPALAMVAGTAAVVLTSLWLGGDGVTSPQRKLMMIMQVMLPLMGLLVGQRVDDTDKNMARAFLVVISIVVPWQFLATKLHGADILTHDLYAFSIYSHRQYVTLIFVCAFAYALTSLWDEHRLWLCILLLPMSAYVSRSFSFLTISAYGALLVTFVVWRFWICVRNRKRIRMFLILFVTMVLVALSIPGKVDRQDISSLFLGKFEEILEGHIPSNVEERFRDWVNFGNGIVESKTALLVGHPQPLPREVRTSPHNWYLDIVYNFGLIGLIPIFALMGYTASLCWKKRKILRAETWWLAAIVFFLVVIDSNFKVTLRQPYPGIFAFFMWGLLLSRLRPTAARQGA